LSWAGWNKWAGQIKWAERDLPREPYSWHSGKRLFPECHTNGTRGINFCFLFFFCLIFFEAIPHYLKFLDQIWVYYLGALPCVVHKGAEDDAMAAGGLWRSRLRLLWPRAAATCGLGRWRAYCVRASGDKMSTGWCW
jgi:hypothetical protein